MSRGDNWSERECLLAIWAYSVMDRDRGVRKAGLYKRVAKITGRSPESVEYKVQNVSACDPRPRPEKPISEKSNYQGILKGLFDRYASDTTFLDEMSSMFHGLGEEGLFAAASAEPGRAGDRFITEGDKEERGGLSRSRSALLREEARKRFRARDGSLRCDACGASYDHLAKQGIIGREIIQVHHLAPIGELDVARPERLEIALTKVAPLCPTCHALLHAHCPLLTPLQLKSLLPSYHTAGIPQSAGTPPSP